MDLTWSQQLRALADTQDELIVFTFALILGAMMIDFLTGSIAAKINPNIQFISKAGVNGILRKIASIALLAFCIPLSVVLPEGIGPATLQVLYTGYLFYELLSIVENAKKLGLNTEPLEAFINKFYQGKKEEDQNHDQNH